MWPTDPWPQSRAWPTAAKGDNSSAEARGFVMMVEPEEAIASLLAWSAVAVVGSAACVAGLLLAGAKWFGGDR